MFIDLLIVRAKGYVEKNKSFLKKLTVNSLITKTIGFSVMLAMASLQMPATKTEPVWASEVRLDTTQAVPIVLPEKQVVIKVQKPKVKSVQVTTSYRTVVARERVMPVTTVVPKSKVKKYAYDRVSKKWGPEHWAALNILWQRESGWNYRATNGSSGACGIPQACPCSKVGGDYRSNPNTQIDWGLNYIAARYGNPTRALAFWNAHHWY